MTVAQFRSMNVAEQLLLKAVGLSLAIHLAAFGGWTWSRTHASWKPFSLPRWLQVLPHDLPAALARSLPSVQLPQPPPLIYVEVNPALATAEPPVNPKFYSTADTRAANPEKTIPSEQPQISGTQDKVIKTVAPAPRAEPLRPSPPAPPRPEMTAAATAVKPAAASAALPKPASTAGDLVQAKPAPKVEAQNGTSATDHGTNNLTEPPHVRPRTLAQAAEQQGAPGARTRQPGGVNRLAFEPSVDAVRTSYGDYDRDLIDAVQARWYYLLNDRQVEVAGKVVLEFNLHTDGRISDMKRVYSDVNELLSLICQQAVLDPAPYKPWSSEMRKVINDPRPVRFAFYYSY
jgi:hypothetical protein